MDNVIGILVRSAITVRSITLLSRGMDLKYVIEE